MRILRLPEVSQATGLSRSTIYRLVRSGTFPQSVALTARTIGWYSTDIEPGLQRGLPLPRIRLINEHMSPDLKVAQKFIRLITLTWDEIDDDLTTELRTPRPAPAVYSF